VPERLKPYDQVPTGFEIVETGREEVRRSQWFNCTLRESSDGWDKEIRAVNKLQEDLGPLGDDARLVRAQIAAFARCSYTFPESVGVVLESIAAGCVARPRFFVGCENDVLSFFSSDAPRDEKEATPPEFTETLRSYVGALLKWLRREAGGFGEPRPGVEDRVAELLGTPTDFKKALVDYLLVTLASDCGDLSGDEVRRLDRIFKEHAPEGSGTLVAQTETHVPASAIADAVGIEAGSLAGFRDLSQQGPDGTCYTQHNAARAIKVLRAASGDMGLLDLGALSELKAVLGVASIPGWWTKEFAQTKAGLKRPLDQIFEIASRIAFFHNSPCHKKYFRHAAILLSSIGEMRMRGIIAPSGNDAFETNRILLDYLAGLNAWLSGETKGSMMLGRARDRQRVESVFDSLGEPAPVKRWLAACLWKTLKSGHSWNKCIELDRDPALVPASWLKRAAA
jgi:hypothetical protein